MKKSIYVGNIISALPSLLVVPLVPFIFILIHGEGKIPGYFHEYLLRTLMVVYPLALIACVITSLKIGRQGNHQLAVWISLVPLAIFAALVATLVFGGIVLR